MGPPGLWCRSDASGFVRGLHRKQNKYLSALSKLDKTCPSRYQGESVLIHQRRQLDTPSRRHGPVSACIGAVPPHLRVQYVPAYHELVLELPAVDPRDLSCSAFHFLIHMRGPAGPVTTPAIPETEEPDFVYAV